MIFDLFRILEKLGEEKIIKNTFERNLFIDNFGRNLLFEKNLINLN